MLFGKLYKLVDADDEITVDFNKYMCCNTLIIHINIKNIDAIIFVI
jgi:hypothetical protein